jgi:hypothetical protein
VDCLLETIYLKGKYPERKDNKDAEAAEQFASILKKVVPAVQAVVERMPEGEISFQHRKVKETLVKIKEKFLRNCENAKAPFKHGFIELQGLHQPKWVFFTTLDCRKGDGSPYLPVVHDTVQFTVRGTTLIGGPQSSRRADLPKATSVFPVGSGPDGSHTGRIRVLRSSVVRSISKSLLRFEKTGRTCRSECALSEVEQAYEITSE